MGRELQKKKNRSSLPKVKQKPKSKKLNLRANPIVAANWEKSQTLSQNYRRLGLVSKLNARPGGVEKFASSSSSLHPASATTGKKDALAIANKNPTALVPRTARIERDPETGAIVRVLRDDDDDDDNGGEKGRREWNGRVLRDVLDEGGEEDERNAAGRAGQQHDLPGLVVDGGGGGNGVVPEMVMQAAMGGGRKRPRKQSKREEEWVEQLVARYGDDVGKMARDRKMNPMQQSEGDIARRVRMWKEGRRKTGEEAGQMR
ncbi:MAG: hypothetical protein LQ348_000971 [Seirophora lacunosa]|nr:MAG: hypothetical protein LQ348_000971 [Seirophora lacunosa]